MHNSTTSRDSIATAEHSDCLTTTQGDETIVAIATPTGVGGIAIVRLSGFDVPKIMRQIVGADLTPRVATHCVFSDETQTAIDSGIAVYFAAPASYTGEPVLELQGHGSPVVAQMLVDCCLQLGARLARPGEFSERAFLNGRIDLVQAEAVADLIHSQTQQAALSAVKSMQGAFSMAITHLVDALTQLRIYVEAAIDFPEEEIDLLQQEAVKQRLENIEQQFDQLDASVTQGQLLRDGIKVVIAGPPNAGKSSLLNVLAKQDRAIVSATAGTTRDTLEQTINLDGLRMRIIDTAGIRTTEDAIEAEGIRRAQQAISEADLILLIVDNTTTSDEDICRLKNTLCGQTTTLILKNKIDLKPVAQETQGVVALSTVTQQGIDCLTKEIKQAIGFRDVEASQFIARSRHIDALNRARQHLQKGVAQLSAGATEELFAEDLHACQQALGEITGEVSSDALLGMIFSSFCIGK